MSVGPSEMTWSSCTVGPQDFAAFEAGELGLGVIASNLGEHDEAYGVFERRD